MALSEDDQRDVLSRVRELILADFHEEFQEIYSYSVTVLELAPEQANNEIRNALNHVARALTSNNMEVATENLGQAKGHIERAKRDCLKLAVIHLHEQIKSDLLSIEMIEGAVPLSIKMRLKTIEDASIKARQAESNGDEDVTDNYTGVFADFKNFRDDLHKQFNVPSKARAWWQQLLIRIRHQTAVLIVGLVVGFLSGIAANWAYGYFFPSPPAQHDDPNSP